MPRLLQRQVGHDQAIGRAGARDDPAAGGRRDGAARGARGVARRGAAAAGRERDPEPLAVGGERARRVADPDHAR